MLCKRAMNSTLPTKTQPVVVIAEDDDELRELLVWSLSRDGFQIGNHVVICHVAAVQNEINARENVKNPRRKLTCAARANMRV